jgi:butyryl-CoA dehydrogenase
MVPIVKGFSTEMSVEVASIGVQVHGGMGFIEETGAAQFYRDARILPIYEGTTAIQANDLVGRKTSRDTGAAARSIVAQVKATANAASGSANEDLQIIGAALSRAAASMQEVVDFVVRDYKSDIKAVFAGSVPYLKLAGLVVAGWQLARSALIASEKIEAKDGDLAFYRAKLVTARFFADHQLSQVSGIAHAITAGAASVLAAQNDDF